MDNDSVFKADEIKLARMEGQVPPEVGARPKRKKGYHRALKRGEVWAHLEKGRREIMNRLVADIYCPEGEAWGVNAAMFSGKQWKK